MTRQFKCKHLFSAYSTSLSAVIFDMDGSLVETTQADYQAWRQVFEDHERSLSYEEYFPLLGMKSESVVRDSLGLTGDHVMKALARKLLYFERIADRDGIELVPHAKELLHAAFQLGVPLALATSSRKKKMEHVMRLTELYSFFDFITTGEEVNRSKPAPDIFLHTAKKFGIDPADCLVFEDAATGVSAAKEAGMKCIAITTTHSAAFLHQADLVINSYDEIVFSEIKSPDTPAH